MRGVQSTWGMIFRRKLGVSIDAFTSNFAPDTTYGTGGSIGLGAASLIAGLSESFPIRLLQGIAVFAAGAVIVGGAVVLVMIRLAG